MSPGLGLVMTDSNFDSSSYRDEKRRQKYGAGLAFDEWLARRQEGAPMSASGTRSHRLEKDSLTLEPADRLLNAELQRRVSAVERGAGRLFRVRAGAVGYVHVHSSPSSPYLRDNVVARLEDGDVVLSMGSAEGAWLLIQLPEGTGSGWCVRELGGVQRLLPHPDY